MRQPSSMAVRSSSPDRHPRLIADNQSAPSPPARPTKTPRRTAFPALHRRSSASTSPTPQNASHAPSRPHGLNLLGRADELVVWLGLLTTTTTATSPCMSCRRQTSRDRSWDSHRPSTFAVWSGTYACGPTCCACGSSESRSECRM